VILLLLFFGFFTFILLYFITKMCFQYEKYVLFTAGPKIILETWLDKSSSPMHALHLGFGIGSFIVPVVANPFLAVFKSIMSPGVNATEVNVTFPNTTLPFTTLSTTSATEQVTVRESRIQWPYLIVATFTILVSFIFFFYQCCGGKSHQITTVEVVNITKNNDTQNNLEKQRTSLFNGDPSSDKSLLYRIKNVAKLLDPGTCTGGRRLYGVQLFALLFLHFFTSFGGERLYGKFIRTYAIDQMHFSGDDATLLNTSFWISLTAGRFAGFVAARWIPIRILILIETTGGLITAIILNFFVHDNDTLLWIFTQPMAFFIAPMIPSGIVWGDFHMKITGFALTFLLFGGSLGAMSYMWIIGYLYDNYGYQTFLYQILAYGISSTVILYILHFSTWGSKGRFDKKEFEINGEIKNTSERKED